MIGRRTFLSAVVGSGLISWTACGASGVPAPGGPVESPAAASKRPSKAKKSDPGPAKDFPQPDPDFARHFTDPIYHDEHDELAPFGSKEGADVLDRWKRRRSELKRCTTLQQMVGADEWTLEDLTAGAPDLDRLLTGYGFTLLLLEGRIDAEGQKAVLAALRRNETHYAKSSPSALPVMVRDLESFPSTDC